LVGIGIGVNTSFTGAMVAVGGPIFGMLIDNAKERNKKLNQPKGHHAGYLYVDLRMKYRLKSYVQLDLG
jgi:hypothetical protein